MNLEFGTKAETLEILKKAGFNIPELYYFSIEEWQECKETVLKLVHHKFSNHKNIIVRSSSQDEDGGEASLAGAYESILNINPNSREEVKKAIEDVTASFDGNYNDQVLLQPMINNITVSGVIMTRCLEDGSPYYVINYDDESGKTDSITGGTGVSKTIFIYNGVSSHDFDSSRVRKMMGLVHDLEIAFPGKPLDIEFGLDRNGIIHLFQVRQICTSNSWRANAEKLVSDKISFVESFVNNYMKRRNGIWGKKNILGVMPDWNPAEIIGVTPRPLAASVYREIITRRVWSKSRELMGYRRMPPEELMVLIAGRPYIDVRNSFNSFLPDGIDSATGEKLINAWIGHLDKNPHLHDKVEFEIAFTIYTPDFTESFNKSYPNLLTAEEFTTYRDLLIGLTNKNISVGDSLDKAYEDILELKRRQKLYAPFNKNMQSFDVLSTVKTLLDDCCEYGTLPFSMIARHGFIAETLLRAIVNKNGLSQGRVAEFKRSIATISGQMSQDYRKVCCSEKEEKEFLAEYGHLRPGTYDILSPRYADRKNLFTDSTAQIKTQTHNFKFELTPEEEKTINKLFANSGITSQDAKGFLEYAAKAISGREYAKFVFTKNLSDALEGLALWGSLIGLSREEVSLLKLPDILDCLYSPLGHKTKEHFSYLYEKGKKECDLSRSFKLSYLIRSARDVYIVPQHRCTPNFITDKNIDARIVKVDTHCTENIKLEGAIACIESADPGYDWIFTRNIAGLITKYGGTNSHMAIRCAEYGLPAAIGCGEMLYNKILSTKRCILDACQKTITPDTSETGFH
ncbi:MULTISPECIES: PEP-utilizing enzyme [unclassified Maridesulfovibrio]|uniref:PEP-utilizing enzyme n=1 Tax=unclassified Maridesulfovibrio TaxID=2794999 RepID=UPI003B3D67DD